MLYVSLEDGLTRAARRVETISLKSRIFDVPSYSTLIRRWPLMVDGAHEAQDGRKDVVVRASEATAAPRPVHDSVENSLTTP